VARRGTLAPLRQAFGSGAGTENGNGKGDVSGNGRGRLFWRILKQRLLNDGAEVVSVDLVPDAARHPALTSLQADIRDDAAMQNIFAEHRFDAVFHIAAMLAHGKMNRELLWSSNVDGPA